MRKFHDGQKLQFLEWNGGTCRVAVGDYGCVSLKVVMENGQLDKVAWAIARHKDGTVVKHNLSHCESVGTKNGGIETGLT